MSKFKPKFTFLMTCAGGGLVSQNIFFAKSSNNFNVDIIAVDINQNVPSAHIADHFYTVPRAEDENYISVLLDICKTHTVSLVIPGSDEEALLLSAKRKMFESENILICAADFKTLEILNDKGKTYKALEQISGIEAPQWTQVYSKEEIIHQASVFHQKIGDIVIKPALSRGGRDIIVISDDCDSPYVIDGGREIHMNLKTFKNEHVKNYNTSFPVIIMQRLIEPVHDVDILSMSGIAHRIVPRKRLHSSAPNSGHKLVNNKDLVKIAQSVIKHFHLSWLQDIDVMFDKKGTPYVLEINPRPSGSFAISVAAGVPLFDDLIYLSHNKNLKHINIDFNQTIIPFTSLYRTK